LKRLERERLEERKGWGNHPGIGVEWS